MAGGACGDARKGSHQPTQPVGRPVRHEAHRAQREASAHKAVQQRSDAAVPAGAAPQQSLGARARACVRGGAAQERV